MVALLVVATIVCFLAIDLVVQAVERRRSPVTVTTKVRQAKFARQLGLWHRPIPSGVFVDPGHAWSLLDPTGSLKVGVDQLVLAAIGTVDRIETLPIGTEVRRGQPILRLYRGEQVLEVGAPASGAVREWNGALFQDPRLATDRLYADNGWLIKIVPDHLDEDLGLWKIARESARWIQSEVARVRALAAEGLFSATPVPVAADGGDPVEGFLAEAHPMGWDRFNESFLHTHPTTDHSTSN